MSGFEAYNDSGTIQFTTSINAFYFVGKGSISTAFSGNGLKTDGSGKIDPNIRYYNGSVTTSFDFDLVVFNVSSGYVVPFNTGTSSRVVQAWTDSATTVNYWCFRSMQYLSPAAAGSGAGIEIYNYDSSVLYSSVQKPLKVIQNIPIDVTNGTPTGVTSVSTSSGTHGLISYGQNEQLQQVSGGLVGFNYYAIGANDNGSGTVSYTTISGKGKYDVLNPKGGIIVVDVSGY